MYQTLATVRDYNASADTCSVELTAIGSIDVWLDGVKINPTVPRSLIVFGAQVTVAMPDAHRICEAVVIGPGALSGEAQSAPAAGVTPTSNQKTEFGRGSITLDGTGAGSQNVVFPTPFSAAPIVRAFADTLMTPTLSAISTTGFTIAVSGSPFINGTQHFSWQATGNA